MKTIRVGTEYKDVGGNQVRIYATDGGNGAQIHGAVCINDHWMSRNWTASGQWDPTEISPNDINLTTPYDDIEIDTPVLVSDAAGVSYFHRHFAGVSELGSIMTYPDGKTSWTVYHHEPLELWARGRVNIE